MNDNKKIAKELFGTIIRSFALSRKQVMSLVDVIFFEMNVKGDFPEGFDDDNNVFPNNRRGKLLCVDKNLKVVDDSRKAQAVVAFFQEEDIYGKENLEGLNVYGKLVNIAFLQPIAHNKLFREHSELVEQWNAEHYPEYHSTLISERFHKLAKKFCLDTFNDCWTRSYESEGYPTYRNYLVSASSKRYDVFETVVPNVYVSLVMTEDDFLKINPDINWENYITE